MNSVPDNLAKTIVELHGELGVHWLNRLPSIVAEYAERWSLTVMPPFQSLSYNFVAPAFRADGSAVVFKLGVAKTELLNEVMALELFNGRGIVHLLEADPDHGAMLLERLKPGTRLSELADDEETTSIAAQLMRQFWVPAPSQHQFPTVQNWAAGLKRMRERFGGGTGPFPSTMVSAAETLFEELIGSMAEPVLLHGDFHHENILAAERQPWLAIDPKGVVGEPAYEVGAFLRNRMPQRLEHRQLREVLARRADQLAKELRFDRERLVGWAFAQAVLAAWWSYEDHGHGWEPWLACADTLLSLN